MTRTTSYEYSARTLRRIQWRAVILVIAAAVAIMGVAAATSLGDPSDALAWTTC
jgi:hypothetical protein